MKAFVGVTDWDWFDFLRARPHLDEVNFWQPSGRGVFRALDPGDLFLFKLHAPRNFIVGGGTFLLWQVYPAWLAWEAMEKNGAGSFEEMRLRIARYRRQPISPTGVESVGCIVLRDPFFFAEGDWIPTPADWGRTSSEGRPTRPNRRSVAL